MKTIFYRILGAFSILCGDNVLYYQKYDSYTNSFAKQSILLTRKSTLKVFVDEKNFKVPNIRDFKS